MTKKWCNNKARNFIEKIQLIHHTVQEQLEKSQRSYKARRDKHRVDHKFQVGDEVSLYINKEILQGEHKKLNPIHYGPFKILENIGNNAFKLDLPPYMQIYYVTNIKNLRLFEPLVVDNLQYPLFLFFKNTKIENYQKIC